MKWTVTLTKAPSLNDFREGFFPRTFFYKYDAQALVAEVRRKGGDADITKVRYPLAKQENVK